MISQSFIGTFSPSTRISARNVRVPKYTARIETSVLARRDHVFIRIGQILRWLMERLRTEAAFTISLASRRVPIKYLTTQTFLYEPFVRPLMRRDNNLVSPRSSTAYSCLIYCPEKLFCLTLDTVHQIHHKWITCQSIILSGGSKS